MCSDIKTRVASVRSNCLPAVFVAGEASKYVLSLRSVVIGQLQGVLIRGPEFSIASDAQGTAVEPGVARERDFVAAVGFAVNLEYGS